MNKITVRKIRIDRENGRLPTPALKTTGSLMVRDSATEAAPYGADVGRPASSRKRELQTFNDALRDSIRQNRSAIEKLSKR
ncbi:hypothetical protein [Tahibacter caeni]|uniref:hypothetical protein n=1 Tax=Tahibacter caeni TaxID=1453545 RepID=UPI00214909B9|nr:hypothetical protein [Tahibacter caeni]